MNRASTRPAPAARLRVVGKDEEPPPNSWAPADFQAAFRQHYGLAHRMLRSYGVPDATLDDAAQDVFMIVHRRWHDYDGRAPFKKWLLGIVRRVAKDYRRSASRLDARLSHVVPPSSPPDPEHCMADQEAVAAVEHFLTGLDLERREVFVLADIEGLTAPEIAGVLGANLNTVYSRLRAARQRFDAFLSRRRQGQGHGTP